MRLVMSMGHNKEYSTNIGDKADLSAVGKAACSRNLTLFMWLSEGTPLSQCFWGGNLYEDSISF